MKTVIWVVAISDGTPVQAWLVECDVNARGGRGYAAFTSDVAQAMTFPSLQEALEYWRRPSTVTPLRPDGRPNRPLTAYTVELQPIEMEATYDDEDGV